MGLSRKIEKCWQEKRETPVNERWKKRVKIKKREEREREREREKNKKRDKERS